MSTMTPVAADAPLSLAWEAFKDTEAFQNSKRWAADPNHLQGSLWALFSAGWDAGLSAKTMAPAHLDRGPGFIKPDDAEHVYFYEQDFYVLSNFSAFKMTFPIEQHLSRWFDTSEQCYQWLKFGHLAGRGVQTLIEDARSAHEAFKIAGEHKELRRPDWDDEKVGVMRKILRAKAEQHEYVRRKLLATGERELIEDSWRDPYWGWGPNRDGQNMLGKLWMQIRGELRQVQERRA